MYYLIIMFYLLGAHALFDFALQGDAVAINKNRHLKTALQKTVPWYFWMLSHTMSHGFAVACLLKFLSIPIEIAVLCGLVETGLHFAIDYYKCEKLFGIIVDQLLHVACKIILVLIILGLQ